MPILSKKVYLESSVMSSFIDRAHPKHEQAAAFFRYFAQEEYLLFTDSIAIMDTYNYVYSDISPSLAKDFLKTVSLSNINILYPDESDMKAALRALINFQSTELTYQQALVAVLANRRGIPQVCTLGFLHQLFDLSLFYLPI